MLIAIAGTHRVGKTTLVEAFAKAYPDFDAEPEPYEKLSDEVGEEFLEDLSPDAFDRQVEFFRDRVVAAPPGQRVIFDRSPFDFLAYIRASDDLRLGVSNWDLPESVLNAAQTAIQRLDLVALARPTSTAPRIGRPRQLRLLVDGYLSDLILRDAVGLLSGPRAPQVLELSSSTSRRLQQLGNVVERSARSANSL